MIRSSGEEIFQSNAAAVVRDLRMPFLDLSDGSAVEIVRYCIAHKCLPQPHRRRWLEQSSPELLAYLDAVEDGGKPAWREAEERIRKHGALLRATNSTAMTTRPWLLFIWLALPEMAVIGRSILTGTDTDLPEAGFELAADHAAESGDGAKGKAGEATGPKPTTAPTFAFRSGIRIPLTSTERKTFGFPDDPNDEAVTPPNDVPGPGGKEITTGLKRGPK